jgi:penicillin-binding protein 1A
MNFRSKTLWKLYGYGLAAVVVFFLLTSLGMFGKLPDLKELENPTSNLASEIYSSDSVLIGKFYIDNRTNIEYKDLPQNLVQALIATEDERFYDHSGIDIIATIRAVAKLGKDGGGSTITQQLAKNLFTGGSRNIIARIFQKAKEYVISIRLERRYTKEEIIALYLNTVDFINNASGIHSASRVYFDKLPKDLTVEESAVLVGMLKGPSQYNPKSNPKDALARRNTVLQQMVKNNVLSEEDYAKISKKPIELDFTPINHNEGLAPYFRDIIAQELKKWAKDNPRPDGESYNIYKDGLKIYTTINAKMQKYAEEAVQEHLSEYQKLFKGQYGNSDPFDSKLGKERLKLALKQSEHYRRLKDADFSDSEAEKIMNERHKMSVFSYKGEKDTVMSPLDSIKYHMMFLQTGFMVMDPENGHVKAWVGGIDFKFFKFDHCNINTKRQVGSTWKPILYALAMDNGWSPCITVPAGNITIGNWVVKGKGGFKSLKKCLATSDNACAGYLVRELGPTAMIEMGERMGVKTKLPHFPAMSLGSGEVSLFEMMTVYSCFPSGGIRTIPLMITRIEDKNRNVIQSFISERVEAFSNNTAYKMIGLMKGVVDPGGTGARLKGGYGLQNLDIAGKTGTTNKNVDAWFMGFTPGLVGGVWVGNDEQFLRFRSTYLGQGSHAAMPIWGKFFQKINNDPQFKEILSLQYFTPTDSTLKNNICDESMNNDNDGFIPLEEISLENEFNN